MNDDRKHFMKKNRDRSFFTKKADDNGSQS